MLSFDRAIPDGAVLVCPIAFVNSLLVRKLLSKMAKSKKKKETTFLVCQETGDYNYTLLRKTGGEKLQLKKYCPRLRKITLHIEKKK